jgi:hypothetical protein
MKRISTIGVLVFAIAVADLCGCASKSSDNSTPQSSTTGTSTDAGASQPPKKPKDKRPLEQRLAVGMTTDQVKDACGKPKNISMNSDGSAVWMYNNSEMAFIPNYSLFGGRVHYVTVVFDSAGKVKSWSSGSNGMY